MKKISIKQLSTALLAVLLMSSPALNAGWGDWAWGKVCRIARNVTTEWAVPNGLSAEEMQKQKNDLQRAENLALTKIDQAQKAIETVNPMEINGNTGNYKKNDLENALAPYKEQTQAVLNSNRKYRPLFVGAAATVGWLLWKDVQGAQNPHWTKIGGVLLGVTALKYVLDYGLGYKREEFNPADLPEDDNLETAFRATNAS